MTTTRAFMLLWLLAPLLAGADTLDVYANLTGKTVLRPSALPPLPDSIIADLPADKTKAIAEIEKAFSERGLEVVQDGPHFVRVVPGKAAALSAHVPLRGAELAQSVGQGSGGAGMIDFENADLNQVLDIYAEMRRRTILRPLTLPAPTMTLKSQSGLSSVEVEYAVRTVLALNGIRVVDDGVKFMQVVPMLSQVTTNAPKPEPGAKLFDPKKLPSMGVSQSPGLVTETDRMEQEWQRLRKAFYDFMHLQDPRKRSAQRLLALYADLAGKSLVPSQDLGGLPIWFHVQTPLTKNELLYAIETTLTLHGLAIIAVDDHKIRLGRISEVLKNVRGRLERVPSRP